MWFLLPFAAAAGAILYELLRPTPKSEVVQFTAKENEELIEANERGLKAAGIEYETHTDGVNTWIMVKPKDRTAAVQVVIATARNAGLLK